MMLLVIRENIYEIEYKSDSIFLLLISINLKDENTCSVKIME